MGGGIAIDRLAPVGSQAYESLVAFDKAHDGNNRIDAEELAAWAATPHPSLVSKEVRSVQSAFVNGLAPNTPRPAGTNGLAMPHDGRVALSKDARFLEAALVTRASSFTVTDARGAIVGRVVREQRPGNRRDSVEQGMATPLALRGVDGDVLARAVPQPIERFEGGMRTRLAIVDASGARLGVIQQTWTPTGSRATAYNGTRWQDGYTMSYSILDRDGRVVAESDTADMRGGNLELRAAQGNVARVQHVPASSSAWSFAVSPGSDIDRRVVTLAAAYRSELSAFWR